ncbi:MAG: hypothetical protein K2W95_10615 [Candidatus Obscuribacterales bacterium]|nr:hypothetical protein [Candidatus Obscuribacterales bacterium]
MESSGNRATDNNLDSTAKLMSEALSKASAELEKLVSVFCDHLTTFNQELGRSFVDEARSAEDRMDTRLRNTIEALQRDREEILKRLAEYKQNEIQAIIDTGKESRGRLAIRVDETAAEFSRTLSEKMTELQALLSGPQADALAKYDAVRGEVAATGQDLLSFLTDKSAGQLESLATASEFIESEATNSVAEAIAKIDALLSARSGPAGTSEQQFTSAIAAQEKSAPQVLDATKQQSLDALKLEQTNCLENLKAVTLGGKQYAEEVSVSFDVSMSDLSSLLNTLYDARLKNMLAQSRTEIMNAARKAEERIMSTRNDLHATLKELQRDYVEKFEKLYETFEKSVDEEVKDAKSPGGAKDARAREQLNALFRRLGQEMIDTAGNAANRIEGDFQKSVTAFEKRIENARDSACESLEREFKLMQKELVRTKQDFDKQVTELQTQLVRIEKDGRDAADIVQTIRSASLEF